MPNNAYRRGDSFEKRVMADLTDRYLCRQVRGSKGAFDLMAIPTAIKVTGGGYPLLIQAKSGDRIVEHAPWNELLDLARATLSVPIVADWDPLHGRRIRYRLITGYHLSRSRDWPAEVYEP